MARRSTNSVQANVRHAQVKTRRAICGDSAGAKSASEIRRWLIGRDLFEETK